MQSKGFIKLIAVLLALACVYQLSFTFKTRGVEKQAAAYAAQFPLDQQGEAEQHYLDSVQNLPVYNLGFRKFTYKECKEKELNLGLDLKGGMNVVLKVGIDEVFKSLSDHKETTNPAFAEALKKANEETKNGGDYVDAFARNFQAIAGEGKLATVFATAQMNKVKPNSTDAEVISALRENAQEAVDNAYLVVRALSLIHI